MLKNVIVTGASSGIGLKTIKDLLEEGFFVSACSRSLSKDLENIISNNDNICFYNFDLESRDSIKKMARDIFTNKSKKEFGLVNCAGMPYGGLFSMTKIEELEKVFSVNYFNQLYLIQLITKKLIRNRDGSIINIASIAGVFGDAGTIAYGGSKAALIHSTKVLSHELGQYNIRVNSISPAIVNTKMSKEMDQNSIDMINSRKSISGDINACDISSLVKFLLSDETKNLSGQNIRIDQGMFV